MNNTVLNIPGIVADPPIQVIEPEVPGNEPGDHFARRLDQYRYEHKKSMGEIASMVGIHPSSLYEMRKCRRTPALHPLLRLAQKTTPPVAWWLGETGETLPRQSVDSGDVTLRILGVLGLYCRAHKLSVPALLHRLRIDRNMDRVWHVRWLETRTFTPKMSTLFKFRAIGLGISELIGETPWIPK